MQPFQFTRVQSSQDAVRSKTVDAKFIGGGTNLLDLMKLDIEKPAQVIDINGLGLRQIEMQADGSVRIGALVRNSELAYHTGIQQKFPVLSQAILAGASPQLRNMATTGGNLLQRTRCPYFYDTAFPCNKRSPGTGCSAIKGYNRTHAILGTSDQCIATHPSDMCVAMAALDAVIQVQGPSGTRDIPFSEFHLLPGSTPNKETSLATNELIIAVVIPATPFAGRSVYHKVRDRSSYEFALASAAVALDIQGGRIKEARIAMGGVGTKPWRSQKAEKVLAGTTPHTSGFNLAADEFFRNAKGYKHNSFKTELGKRTLVYALSVAADLV